MLIDVNLSGARLNEADFSDAGLGFTDLEGVNLREADLSGTGFAGVKLTDGSDLRGANLTDARLEYCDISPDTKLEGVTWSEPYIPEEQEAREEENDGKRAKVFRRCATVYRQIKLSYQESGQYQRAGSFFIREKECQRFAMTAEGPPTQKGRSWLRRQWDTISHYGTRALWWLSNKTCQHGENPTRLLGVMLVLVLFFAGVHSVCGIVDNAAAPAEGVQYIIAPGLEMGDPAQWLGQMVEALYFSVVTFTSLGYGDMRPATHAGKILAMVEVSLGICLITVFVGCVIRKLSR